MTLIFAAGRQDYVIQVGDRRLTSIVDGRAITADDDACKVLLLKLRNADYLIGYTGLAAVEGKPMIRYIVDCFTQAWEQNRSNPDTIWPLARIQLRELFLSAAFRRFRPKDRRFTVMAAGFIYDDLRQYSSPRYVLMSNFQEWGVADHDIADVRFNFLPFAPKSRPDDIITFIQAVGAYGVVSRDDIEAIRDLLETNSNPRHVKNKIRGLFARYAQDNATIGPGLNMSILYPGGDFDVDVLGSRRGEDFGTYVLDLTGDVAVFAEAIPIRRL